MKSNTDSVKKNTAINSNVKHLPANDIEQSQAERHKNYAILYGIEAEVVPLNRYQGCSRKTASMVFQAIRIQTTAATEPIALNFTDENTKWDLLKRLSGNQRKHEIVCKLDESAEACDQQ